VLIKSGRFGLPGKKTIERVKNVCDTGRRDGKSSRTPEKKTKPMVFEEEKISHNQKSDSNMCSYKNSNCGVCGLREAA
jgi:hypothetical protein